MARRDLKQVDIAAMGLAEKWKLREEAAQQVSQLQAFIDEVDTEVKKQAGDAEELTLYGRPVFLWHFKESYRYKEFTEVYPVIADAYMVEKTVKELDKAALVRDHKDKLAEFQSREFRRIAEKGSR